MNESLTTERLFTLKHNYFGKGFYLKSVHDSSGFLEHRFMLEGSDPVWDSHRCPSQICQCDIIYTVFWGKPTELQKSGATSVRFCMKHVNGTTVKLISTKC